MGARGRRLLARIRRILGSLPPSALPWPRADSENRDRVRADAPLGGLRQRACGACSRHIIGPVADHLDAPIRLRTVSGARGHGSPRESSHPFQATPRLDLPVPVCQVAMDWIPRLGWLGCAARHDPDAWRRVRGLLSGAATRMGVPRRAHHARSLGA